MILKDLLDLCCDEVINVFYGDHYGYWELAYNDAKGDYDITYYSQNNNNVPLPLDAQVEKFYASTRLDDYSDVVGETYIQIKRG